MAAPTKNEFKFKHYHMCANCVTKVGGVFPEGHVCTGIYGTCEYCNTKDMTLIPWVDFDFPKEKDVDRAAKIGRD